MNMNNNRKLQNLLENKLSTDEKVPKTGRLLRNKIFVIGFPPNCTEMDLEKFFSNFGSVRETRIVRDENGVTKGFAFITFLRERSVVNALEYRGPIYFMDRKLSINPAIKKQYPSESSTIDVETSPSDSINSANNTISMMPLPIPSHPNGITFHPYYQNSCQPFFHIRFPSHPIYCSSTSPWHPYYSTSVSYSASCPYLSMTNPAHGTHQYLSSMIRYSQVPSNNKIVS